LRGWIDGLKHFFVIENISILDKRLGCHLILK